jgi:hypothetical protein
MHSIWEKRIMFDIDPRTPLNRKPEQRDINRRLTGSPISAITGKPLPTPPELFSSRQDLIADFIDTLGRIADPFIRQPGQVRQPKPGSGLQPQETFREYAQSPEVPEEYYTRPSIFNPPHEWKMGEIDLPPTRLGKIGQRTVKGIFDDLQRSDWKKPQTPEELQDYVENYVRADWKPKWNENQISDYIDRKHPEWIMGNERAMGYWNEYGRKLAKMETEEGKEITKVVNKIVPDAGELFGMRLHTRANKPLEEILQRTRSGEFFKPVLSETGAAHRTLKKMTMNQPYSRESVEYVNHLSDQTKALRLNQKTGLSIDFCTDCAARHVKGPCPYCYVDALRTAGMGTDLKIIPAHGPKIGEYPLTEEIRNMPDELVDILNRDGGLRMFSLGDYRPKIDEKNVQRALEQAHEKSLYIKAITKVPEFVRKFGDDPLMRINVSVDNLPRWMSNAPTIDEADALKAGRENIAVRSVALNEAEAWENAADPRINIVTLYHGPTNFDKQSGKRTNNLFKIISRQNPGILRRMGKEKLVKWTDTWKNMGHRSDEFKRLAEAYPHKVCCQGGSCPQDTAKCGFRKLAIGLGMGLLAGVHLPDDEEE